MDHNNPFALARDAGSRLNLLSVEQINDTLNRLADAIPLHAEAILAANRLDLGRMDRSNPLYDRLQLTGERLAAIADDIRSVAALVSPVGEVISRTTRPSGIEISKVRVPFGVIGVIYEARPNVTFDVFSLCFKTQNAAILKGGGDARNSNEAIVKVIHTVLEQCGITRHAVTLLPPDREYTAQLLAAEGFVDLIIPRGSAALIRYVRENSLIPVIETGAGVCHTYFDADGDLSKGEAIIFNAKTRRVSVCNALDCLIIHKDRLGDLPALCSRLADKNVIIYADAPAFGALRGHYPDGLLEHSSEEDYGREFMDYRMSVKTAADIEEAIGHIAQHSSCHSEAIITENPEMRSVFMKRVDAACVYANVSTAFTDGAQFGLGAEIGISTQKLHARGPMGLEELTSYKYLITGDGQVRQ